MVDCTPRGTPPKIDVGMVARNTGGPGTAPYLLARRSVLLRAAGRSHRSRKWRGAGEQFRRLDRGPLRRKLGASGSYCCGTFMTWQQLDVPVASASRVSLRVFCAPGASALATPCTATRRCATSTVTVADEGLPERGDVGWLTARRRVAAGRPGRRRDCKRPSRGASNARARSTECPSARSIGWCDCARPAPCANGSDSAGGRHPNAGRRSPHCLRAGHGYRGEYPHGVESRLDRQHRPRLTAGAHRGRGKRLEGQERVSPPLAQPG